MIRVIILLPSLTFACSRGSSDGEKFISEAEHQKLISEKTDRIIFLEDAYNVNNQTIHEKNDIIASKEKAANFYFEQWNRTSTYRKKQEELFLKTENSMRDEIKSKEDAIKAKDEAIKMTNSALQMVVDIQKENKGYFAGIKIKL